MLLQMQTTDNEDSKEEPLAVENALWANTVLASGNAVGVVIYTGADTRSVMNTTSPRSKVRYNYKSSNPPNLVH